MPIYPDRKKGKLTGRFVVEVTRKGRRLRDRCDTLVQAQATERSFRDQLDNGTAPEAKRRFLVESSRAETLSEGIKKAAGRLWSGKAVEVDNFVKLRTIVALMGDKGLDAIDTNFVDDLIIRLLAEGKADGTINRYLSAFNTFLKWTNERGYRKTPLPTFAWRDEDEGRIRWITPEEEEELYSLLSEDTAKLVRIAIHTGMRRSELLSLEPGQITRGWVHIWKTKSGTPRSVPLSPEDEADLRYLVTQGRMPTASSLRYQWDQARAAMGLSGDDHFVFHACRHTCATRMVMTGSVNLRVVQTFLGHKRIETTTRYAHVNDTMLTDALQTVLAHRTATVGATLVAA